MRLAMKSPMSSVERGICLRTEHTDQLMVVQRPS
jgi:hypothetical protein